MISYVYVCEPYSLYLLVNLVGTRGSILGGLQLINCVKDIYINFLNMPFVVTVSDSCATHKNVTLY